MTRFLAAVLAASLPLSATACAADPQIIITTSDPATVKTRMVEAANTVCVAARRHDSFGDFGSLEECVYNSLHNVQIRHLSKSLPLPSEQASR